MVEIGNKSKFTAKRGEKMDNVSLIILLSAAVSALTTKIITANHLKKIDSYFKDGIKEMRQIVIDVISKQK